MQNSDPNPCQNSGACNDGQCSCLRRYKGLFCEIEKDFCELNSCQNGVCQSSQCNCDAGITVIP